MVTIEKLPRREREIAQIVAAHGEASAQEICRALSDPLSNAAVRSMLARIEAKGLLRHRKDGKKYLYRAVRPDRAMREAALRRVSEEYFDGSLEIAAALLADMMDGARAPPGQSGVRPAAVASRSSNEKRPGQRMAEASSQPIR